MIAKVQKISVFLQSIFNSIKFFDSATGFPLISGFRVEKYRCDDDIFNLFKYEITFSSVPFT